MVQRGQMEPIKMVARVVPTPVVVVVVVHGVTAEVVQGARVL